MNFTTRMKQSNDFRDEVIYYLESYSIQVDLYGDRDDHKWLTSNSWQERRKLPAQIRYKPDLICRTPVDDIFFCDTKTGTRTNFYLPKDCYDIYLTYDELHPVHLVTDRLFNPKHYIGQVRISDVKFLDSTKYVSRFRKPHSVIDGWICPDGVLKNGSGGAYGVVDTSNFKLWTSYHDWRELQER